MKDKSFHRLRVVDYYKTNWLKCIFNRFNLFKIISVCFVFLILISPFSFELPRAKAYENNDFVVGMECNYEPFNWQTASASSTAVSIGSAGWCDGYDVQISKIIANELNKKLVIKKIAWDGLQPALESGVINAVIAGMTNTSERQNGIDFTTPYYSSDLTVIVRKNSKPAEFSNIQQFTNYKLMAQKNTIYDDVIDQIKGVVHQTPKESYPLLVYALQNDETDGIVAEMPVAEGIIRSNHDLQVVKFIKNKGFQADTSVSIGLPKGTKNSSFFNQVQTALDKISLTKRKELMLQAVMGDSNVTTDSNFSPQTSGFIATSLWILQNNWPLFLYGTEITILLAILGTIFGFIIGLVLGLGNSVQVKSHDSLLKTICKYILNILIKFYVFVFRGTPMMIQAIFMFYVLRPVLYWEPLTAGLVVISINTGAYMSEIIRSGIQSVDSGQRLAAQSLGMTLPKQLRYIILPQAIRNSFPSIGNQFIVNIKDSCVLNVIGVVDLYFQSNSISGSVMLFAQTFLITCVIYLILTFVAQILLNFIERKIRLDGEIVSSMEYSA
ncbi:MAG: ABC transporter substrate-binding protein/permease [Bifidobacteriaceae bacterium]|jgi:putative lysine transport system permease protein|nr:ABC transporter substrate-binding protein/permease [Bifidobacteriaceae bacterium]